MYISRLSLYSFRNFAAVEEIELAPQGILAAVAPNATGKTNFLESIVVLLRGKSFRARLEECVKWGEDEFTLRATIQEGETVRHLAAAYSKVAHVLRLEEGGEPVSPVALYSAYPAVLFLPDDATVFYRGPGVRRNFLNQTLIHFPGYLAALVQYQRALRQRNSALKTARTPEDVATWSDLLVEYARVLWQQRMMVVDFFQSHLTDMYEAVSGERLALTVRFIPGAHTVDEFASILREAWTYEHKYAYTLHGPHRDDLTIEDSQGRAIQAILSRGQMGGLIAALKILVWRFMKQATGVEPLLLLDDVLSELDDGRQRRLLAALPAAQIILTCTDLPAALTEAAPVHVLDLRAILAAPTQATQEMKKQTVPVAVQPETEAAVAVEQAYV